MEGIFEEEVSSFVSGDGYFGVGDVSGDIAAARLRQRLLSSNDSSGNFYSNILPIDINRWQGGNILNIENNLSSVEEESHGNTDILICSNIDATSVVENALPMVQDFLQNFSSKADLKEQMNLAFGDSYDVSKANVLVDSWQAESLGFLPEIKIVSEDEINGANGAFAGETETIYLAQEFVWENLGNVGAIAHVIVEEFGHYIDGEVNSFDTPGDEGEIFVDLVRGVELSADELLAKQREDDWAIGFLDGERVGIEQKVQSDTLDFFASNITWNNTSNQNTPTPLLDKKFPEKPIQTDFLGGEFEFQPASIKLDFFANWGSLGTTKFSYPADITVDLPNNLKLGETYTLKTGDPLATSPSFNNIGNGSEAFKLPNVGLDFELSLANAKSVTEQKIKNPFTGEIIPLAKFDFGGLNIKSKFDLVSILANQVNFDLLGGKVTAKPPVISSLNSSIENGKTLPSMTAKGKTEDNVINLAFDVDRLLLEKSPQYFALQEFVKKLSGKFPFDAKLEGLRVIIENPSEEIKRLNKGQDIADKEVEETKKQLQASQERILKAQSDLQKAESNVKNIQKLLDEGKTTLSELDLAKRQIDSRIQTIDDLRVQEKLAQEKLASANLIKETYKQKNQDAQEKLKKQPRLDFNADLNILDIVANVGFGLDQEFKFVPEKISLEDITLDDESKRLGGSVSANKDVSSGFDIKAPTQGCGIMKLTTKYKLYGEVQNNIGILLQGDIVAKGLEASGSANILGIGGQGVNLGQLSIGPLLPQTQIPAGGLSTPSFKLIGTNPDPLPTKYLNFSDPTIPSRTIIKPINISNLPGVEKTKETPNGTQNLIVEVEYEIPYNMPVSIDDASIQEGNSGTQEMIFKVTRREVSDQPLTLQYTSDKGDGSVTIEAGQASADIKIPIPGDEAVENDEKFTVTVTDPTGQVFAECKDVDKIEATGTVINDDFPDPPLPEPGPRDTGDPHLITTDGKSYDFQGAGEFNLIESNTGDLKIQARKEPINNDPLTNVSVNTAVATTLGGKRVGIYPEGSHLLIDGNPVEINDSNYLSVADGKIYREGNTYTITYPSGDKLQAEVIDDERLDIAIYLKDERQGQVKGLLGNFNNNPDDEIAKRDGTVFTEPIALEQLYGEFSDSWRVAPNESLFDYKPGEDTNTFTLTNYPRQKVKLSDLNPADLEKAYELIGDRINEIDPNLREGAIIDFVLSGFKESYIESAIKAGSVSAGSVVILDELGAKDDFAFTNANLPIKLNVLSNDTVNPNTPIAIASFDQISTGGGNITQDNNGTPNDPSDDQLFYTPPVNFTGTDRFKYTIFDGTKPATAIVSINIPNLNLATLQDNQGVTIKSTTPGNFTGIAANKIGDINGDQIADIATGAFAADPEGNNAAGETYVIFGNNQPFPENIDPNTLNGSNGFILEGFVQTGFSGGAVSSAGDVNNDGINDMIIGAFGVTTNGQNNVGQAYVIFGSRDPFPPTIDIASLDGTNGFALTGLYEFDYAGSAVGSAGDFNRDGIDDVFVSAPGPLNNQAGRTYVLFGNSSGFPPSQNLSQLNGTNGVIIDGLYTKSGGSVSSAGDVNQDGYSDLIIGADIGGTDSYVVYGGESLPATTLLSNLTNGFKIFGVDVVTDNGTNVSGVGDVNNDGIDDVIVSVTGTAPDGVSGVSKGYVIFGRTGGLPSDVDVKTLNGTNGFVITSANIDGISGMAVSGKGDFNQDGIADIILGKPNDNGNTGNSYVIFGSKESFPTNIDLASLNGTNGIAILGTETDDLTGVSVASAGDVNQDKVDDVIIGAPGNLFNDSPGKSYVVFGDGNFGNSVSLVFDEAYYLANNPEVNSAISSGLVRNGLEHFSQYGVDEERDFRVFLFNEKYYLEQNPDIANLVAQGVYSNGLEHFTQLGQFEGRKPSPATTTTAEINFDEQYYLTQNPDVKSLVEQGILSSGFEHYIEVGQFQQRQTAG